MLSKRQLKKYYFIEKLFPELNKRMTFNMKSEFLFQYN